MTACPLCDLVADTDAPVMLRTEALVLTTCNKCYIPLFVSTVHLREFSPSQQANIRAIAKRRWPGKIIRWTPRKIHDHAHCHIETGG